MWIDDQMLQEAHRDFYSRSWIPVGPMVVLGAANKKETEVHLGTCKDLKVPVLRRYGGGGTVLLDKGCVVISAGMWVRETFSNDRYFAGLNQSVIDVLAARWPVLARLRQNGISDLVDGDYKVAGTSLFRSRNYLLYQASLLITPDLALMERLLAHPSKEPGYRRGRSHRSFLRGVAEVQPDLTGAGVCRAIDEGLEQAIAGRLGGQLCPVFTDQVAPVKRRLAAAPREAAHP